MKSLTQELCDLIASKGIEIMSRPHTLMEELSPYFEEEKNQEAPFKACLDSKFFFKILYHTSLNEALFIRHKQISDFLDEGINVKIANAVCDSLVELAEQQGGREILSKIDKEKQNPYEVLSGAIRNYAAKSYRSALTSLTMLAKNDAAPEVNFHLGKLYYEGKAAQQDYAMAVRYFTRGMLLGSSECIYWLGHCLNYGYGTAQNTSRAVDLFIKAADMGQEDALYIAGCMYKDGTEAVTADIKRAIELLQKSADYGNWSAAAVICDLYFEDAKTTGNFRKTSEAKARVANPEEGSDCYKLALIYEQGIGVARDFQKALTYCAKASAKGYAEASPLMTKLTQLIAAENKK